MISLSAVVWKMDPAFSNSARNCAALTKLPLCAMARGPRTVSATRGCALASVLEPVVE